MYTKAVSGKLRHIVPVPMKTTEPTNKKRQTPPPHYIVPSREL